MSRQQGTVLWPARHADQGTHHCQMLSTTYAARAPSRQGRTAQDGAEVRASKQQHQRGVGVQDVQEQQHIRLSMVPSLPARRGHSCKDSACGSNAGRPTAEDGRQAARACARGGRGARARRAGGCARARLGKLRRLRRQDAPAASSMQPAWPANSMAVKKRWLFSPTHEPTTAQWWSNLSCAPRSRPLLRRIAPRREAGETRARLPAAPAQT
jgi:hypothetical protein